jgi:predicted amidophosphoribosyltransferase
VKVYQTKQKDNDAKPPVMRSALVTPNNWRGMEEWYMAVIECPKCKQKLPAKHTNFCSGCGVKLKMSTTVQGYADSAW